MRLVLAAGARPNFMKVAPILWSLERQGHDAVLVHTGQHYDEEMSDAFFRDLDIRSPDHSLGVGSATHAVQTARVMEAFEPVLVQEAPDWVVVVGDVNSTLACALVTAKLRHEVGCRLAHVEAGLRSRDWRMPEEVNRVLTDRLSDLLLTPSRDGNENLVREGIQKDRIRFVGNVMIDTLLDRLTVARQSSIISDLGLDRGRYAVSTVHRPSNVDQAQSLRRVLSALGAVASELPVVLPVHPRTRDRIDHFGVWNLLEPLIAIEPVGYLDMIALMDGAALILTDSGGIQEETTALGIPCVTLREQTERPITVQEGTNRLAPWPITTQGILRTGMDAMRNGSQGESRPEGWDGKAAERIVDALREID